MSTFKESWKKAVEDKDLKRQLKLYKEWPRKVKDFILTDLEKEHPNLDIEEDPLIIGYLTAKASRVTSFNDGDCFKCDDCGTSSCQMTVKYCEYCERSLCEDCCDFYYCEECGDYCHTCRENHVNNCDYNSEYSDND